MITQQKLLEIEHYYHKNIFPCYFLMKRHAKYYTNVIFSITLGFVEKTRNDERVVFLKIALSA